VAFSTLWGMAQKVVGMDVRLAAAMAQRIDEGVPVAVLCRRLGISRQSFYAYQQRFQADGIVGLLPRSRAPGSRPTQTPLPLEDLLVATRADLQVQGWDYGARSVRARLLRRGIAVPSARTVHRIFVRRGLVDPQPQKRPRSSWRRFAYGEPNGCWQIDGMDWQLADASTVVIVRVLDDCSRKALAATVARTESAAAAWACLTTAMARHGRPALLLSDNSLAFNGDRRGVTVWLQQRLHDLGVPQVSARAYHPQTCGKTEREHQTLQRWLRAQPPTRTMAELSRLVATYDLLYNGERPHQGLDGLATPDERYHATPKAVPASAPLPEQVLIVHPTVNTRGVISVGLNTDIQLGREWEDVPVTAIRSGNHVAVFYHTQLIHSLTVDPNRRYQPNRRPRPGHRLPRRAFASAASLAPATKESRWSARSAARTNDLDAAEPGQTLPASGGHA
jgi:hypothetical protein